MKFPMALVWLGPKSVEMNRPDEVFALDGREVCRMR